MKIGFLSTYPPTQCGLATFTAALAGAIESLGVATSIVRSLDTPENLDLPGVDAEVWPGEALSRRRAADVLNGCDGVIIQHEYGIYGGPDGAEVVDVMRRLRVPVVVVLHTVLTRPSAHQTTVLEAVMASADAVVTMTQAARTRLLALYQVDPGRVVVIPHGAVPAQSRPGTDGDVAVGASRADGDGGGAGPDGPRLLTWGLIGPGKGIEWAIEALAHLRDLDPAPHYLVAGETHPKVLAREGERYREGLVRRATELGVENRVAFDPAYRPTSELPALIASADVVLLPYDSTEQVTSGVLIEAVAAGRPVVATAFPHAVELLADGVGITVPHRDPRAMADAVRRLLTDPDEARRMRALAARTAESLAWPSVGSRYVALVEGLRGRRLAAALWDAL